MIDIFFEFVIDLVGLRLAGPTIFSLVFLGGIALIFAVRAIGLKIVSAISKKEFSFLKHT